MNFSRTSPALSPPMQEVLDAARILVAKSCEDDLPHAIEVCLKYHPDGPFTPDEVASLRAQACPQPLA